MSILRVTDKISTRLKGFKANGYDVKLLIKKENSIIMYAISYKQDNKEIFREESDLECLLNSIDKNLKYEGFFDKDIQLAIKNLKEGQQVSILYNEDFKVELYDAKNNISLNQKSNEILNTALKDIF